MSNRTYGKTVLMEAIVFAFANLVGGFFNYFLSKDLIGDLLHDRDFDHMAIYSSIMIPYFIITEFIPAAAFGYTMSILGKILSGELNEDVQ